MFCGNAKHVISLLHIVISVREVFSAVQVTGKLFWRYRSHDDKRPVSNGIDTFNARSRGACAIHCTGRNDCESFVWNERNTNNCNIQGRVVTDEGEMERETGSQYYGILGKKRNPSRLGKFQCM